MDGHDFYRLWLVNAGVDWDARRVFDWPNFSHSWLFGNVWDHFDLDLEEIRTRQAMQCEHPNLGVPAFS
jgi:hypothetical protein